MTELTTQPKTETALALPAQTEHALAMLPQQSQELIKAALLPAVRTLDPENTQVMLVAHVITLFTLAGQKGDGPQFAQIASAFHRRLLEEFPMATMEEIRIATTNGVYDKYGDYFGISAKSLMMFVRAYMQAEERKRAREEFSKAKRLATAKREYVPDFWTDAFWTEERISTWKNIALEFFAAYKSDNKIYASVPQQVYWLLRHTGHIKMTDEYRDQLISHAEVKLRHEIAFGRQKRTAVEIAAMLQAIEQKTDKNLQNAIRHEARRIAVMHVFERINFLFENAQ